MTRKHNETYHRFYAYLPLVSFFVIIFFLYIVYMSTFIVKLMGNSYDYNQSDTTTTTGTQTMFQAFKSFGSIKDSIISLIQSSNGASVNQEQRGVAYFIIAHILLVLFAISVYRTIRTPPGHVPEEWNAIAEDELACAIEVEKDLIHEKLKKRKKEKEALRLQQAVNLDESTSDHPPAETGKGNESILSQGIQGVQGDNLEDPQVMDQLNQIAFYNAMKKEKKRFCSHCQMFKPARSHHCRQCNKCILKMDHHCPWVGGCVGYANYKYFINMVFYGVILLWFMVATYTKPASDSIFNLHVKGGLVFLIFFTYLLTIALALVITSFFGFHMWLIWNGKTTLECIEEKKKADYNYGLWENLKTAFGTDYWFWCLPFAPAQKEDGLEYENMMTEEKERLIQNGV